MPATDSHSQSFFIKIGFVARTLKGRYIIIHQEEDYLPKRGSQDFVKQRWLSFLLKRVSASKARPLTRVRTSIRAAFY